MVWGIACALVVLAEIDRRTGRLPNGVLLPVVAAAAVLVALHPASGAAAAAATVPYGAGFALRAVGGGDVKLAPVCGAVLGAVPPVLLALMLAGLVSAAQAAATGRRSVPHGPALVAATLLVAAVT